MCCFITRLLSYDYNSLVKYPCNINIDITWNRTKLYTYDRLSEFVDNYTAFVEKKKKKNKAIPATENYKYYNFETSPDAVTY